MASPPLSAAAWYNRAIEPPSSAHLGPEHRLPEYEPRDALVLDRLDDGMPVGELEREHAPRVRREARRIIVVRIVLVLVLALAILPAAPGLRARALPRIAQPPDPPSARDDLAPLLHRRLEGECARANLVDAEDHDEAPAGADSAAFCPTAREQHSVMHLVSARREARAGETGCAEVAEQELRLGGAKEGGADERCATAGAVGARLSLEGIDAGLEPCLGGCQSRRGRVSVHVSSDVAQNHTGTLLIPGRG